MMIFFIENTKFCYKTKLYKLLFFTDFEVFRLTGKSVSNLKYFAWPKGPVPKSLHNEFEQGIGSDLNEAIKAVPASKIDPEASGKTFKFFKRISFDPKLFSTRELKVMREKAEIFETVKSEDISIISHEVGKPWHRVYVQEKRQQEEIPYFYILDETNFKDTISKEIASSIQDDQEEIKRLFG